MRKLFFPTGNGIGVIEERKMSVAIVNQYGNKKVGKVRVKKAPFMKIPFLRGIAFFFYGICGMSKVFFKGQALEKESGRGQNSSAQVAKGLLFASNYIMFFASLIFALLFSLFVFGLLPSYLLKKFILPEEDYYLFTFLLALFRCVLFVLTMLVLRFSPFMQELYRFNGACGKAENWLREKGDFEKTSIYAPLNFLNFTFFALLFCLFMVSFISVRTTVFWGMLANLAIFLASLAILYEIFFLLTNSKMKWPKDIINLFSMLVFIRPSITHIEVVRAVLIEQKFEEGYGEVESERIAISALLAEMQTRLDENENCEKSDYDWIIANVLGIGRGEVKLLRSVSQKEYRDIMRATNRRAKGEPISSIFGFVDFYGVRLDVNKKVLSPRMETEILVENALKAIKKDNLNEICDLCTGSGAIAIAVALNSRAKVTATDISKQALMVAENNAKKNNAQVEFVQSDLFAKLKKRKFDLILSNPPYIRSADIEKLDKEVKNYDPKLALDGGSDGLEFYRKIAKEGAKHLNKKGAIFLEVGQGQAKDVANMLREAHFVEIKVIKDYNNIERIVYGKIGK